MKDGSFWFFFLAAFGIFDGTIMNMTGGNETVNQGPHRGDAGPSSIQNSESDSGSWRKYLTLSSEIEVNQTPGRQAPPLPIESGTVPPANAVTFSEAGPSQVAPPDPSFLIPPEEVSQDALWGALESTARSLMQSRAYRATDRALERFYYEQNELATLLAGMLPQRGIVANAEDVRRAVSALTDDIYENHEGRPKRMRALKNSLINRPEGKAWRNFIQHLRELGVSVNADDGPR